MKYKIKTVEIAFTSPIGYGVMRKLSDSWTVHVKINSKKGGQTRISKSHLSKSEATKFIKSKLESR